ncbi:hypothetical protein ACPWT1_08390 [Ramlibacter sp. MMS24-I3-19]|uniref:hypothetical protein n=1 Tax=Ramlibacter sp. MMS24-I3-19 TaxID=3416606 RepID=UPI003CFDD37A
MEDPEQVSMLRPRQGADLIEVMKALRGGAYVAAMVLLRHPAHDHGSGPSWFRRAVAPILWSGFLAAAALEVLALVLADPQELRWAATTVGWPLIAIHVAGFLVLWLLASAASLLAFLGYLAVGAWKVRTRLR